MATHCTYLMRSSFVDNSTLFNDILKFQPSTRFIKFVSCCKKIDFGDRVHWCSFRSNKGMGESCSEGLTTENAPSSVGVTPGTTSVPKTCHVWFLRNIDALYPQVTVKSLLQSDVVLDLLQIPGNTGCIARTCAATCVGLHLVEVSSLLPRLFLRRFFPYRWIILCSLCIHLSNLCIIICNVFLG